MSRLKKQFFMKTESGIKITIRRNTPRGKGRILTFNKPVLQLELSENEAHAFGWHLDPRSHIKRLEK